MTQRKEEKLDPDLVKFRDSSVELDLKRVYIGRLQIIGAAGVNVRNLDWALTAGARGKLKAVIDRVYPLAAAAAAHDYVERERPLGKVLIAPGLDSENVQID